jgi:hypothetical protein
LKYWILRENAKSNITSLEEEVLNTASRASINSKQGKYSPPVNSVAGEACTGIRKAMNREGSKERNIFPSTLFRK